MWSGIAGWTARDTCGSGDGEPSCTRFTMNRRARTGQPSCRNKKADR